MKSPCTIEQVRSNRVLVARLDLGFHVSYHCRIGLDKVVEVPLSSPLGYPQVTRLRDIVQSVGNNGFVFEHRGEVNEETGLVEGVLIVAASGYNVNQAMSSIL